MNAVDLFIGQVGDIQNTASPLIDLDSIYGPRTMLNSAVDLYEADGKTLRLQTVTQGARATSTCRATPTAPP